MTSSRSSIRRRRTLQKWMDQMPSSTSAKPMVCCLRGLAMKSRRFLNRKVPAIGDALDANGWFFGDKPGNGSHQAGDVQRLLHEGIHTEANGLLVLVRTGGDDNDRQQRGNPVQLAESSPTIPVRHVEVEQDQVGRVLDGASDSFNAIARLVDHVALRFEHFAQRFTNHIVVIGNENAPGGNRLPS